VAEPALTEHEREIVDAKFAATALDQAVNEQLNQLEIEGSCAPVEKRAFVLELEDMSEQITPHIRTASIGAESEPNAEEPGTTQKMFKGRMFTNCTFN
jgi:hypothetical protein